MKIQWLAHAAFLIQGDGLRIITDPYEPEPEEVINLPAITDAADIVIRSSDDDNGHCYVDTIPPGFDLITATDIVETGATARGLTVKAIWSQESLVHKDIPRDNAMYRFTVEGINITHMGDVGNFLTEAQMAAMAGTDILFALTGGPPTIDLADLQTVIQTVKPRVVIPMHYRISGPRFFMFPVTEFTDRYPKEMVEWVDSNEIEFSRNSLPEETRIFVLQPTYTKENDFYENGI